MVLNSRIDVRRQTAYVEINERVRYISGEHDSNREAGMHAAKVCNKLGIHAKGGKVNREYKFPMATPQFIKYELLRYKRRVNG